MATRKNPCPPPPSRSNRRKATGISTDDFADSFDAEGHPIEQQETMYKCSSPNCPGYPYKASEISHPRITCGDGQKMSAAAEATKEQCFENLPVELTLGELAVIDDRVKHLVGEIEIKKAALKSMQSTMGSEIKTLEAQLSSLAKKGRDKIEYREVECERTKDYVRCEVTVIRLDTGKLVSSRTMLREERHLELAVNGKTFQQISAAAPPPIDDDFEDPEETDEDDESEE